MQAVRLPGMDALDGEAVRYEMIAGRLIRVAYGTATTVGYVSDAAYYWLLAESRRMAAQRERDANLARWTDDGGRDL